MRLWTLAVSMILVPLVGCDPAPAVGGGNLIVEAPQPGRILIGDQEVFVDSATPAVFAALGSGPHTVTYIAENRRITLLEVQGPNIDFTGFIGTGDGVGGDRLPVLIRPEPWASVQVRLLSAERIYTPTTTEEGLRFEVLPDEPLTVIALWENELPKRLTVEAIGTPESLQGHNLAIRPRVPLNNEMPVQTQDPPEGWMQAELVYRGQRTGLILGGGRVGPFRAATIPVTSQVDGMSLWVQAWSRGVHPFSSTTSVEASVGTDRPSVALNWLREPDITPRARPLDAILPLTRDGEVWSANVNDSSPGWYDIRLRGLGTCQPREWRIIGEPQRTITLPELPAGDPFDAPLIQAELASVNATGVSFDDQATGPLSELFIAQRTPERGRTTVRNYYRGATSVCDEMSPLAGAYALYRSDAACDGRDVTPAYLIDDCGHLIQLAPQEGVEEVCGRFAEDSFNTPGRSGLNFERADDGIITVGLGNASVRLIPVPEANDDLKPREMTGLWQRYEISEQGYLRLHADNVIPLDDPVRIAAGDASAGPWLEVPVLGAVMMRTAFEQGEFTVTEDEQGLALIPNYPGCEGDERRLAVTLTESGLELQEELPSPAEDEYRVRTYRFQR